MTLAADRHPTTASPLRSPAGAPRAGASPAIDAASARRTPIETLEQLLIAHVGAVLDAAGLADGRGPVVLMGAGQHTWWLLHAVPELRRVAIAAIADDAAPTDETGTGPADGRGRPLVPREMLGIPVLRPEVARARVGMPRAVILSTDTWQGPLRARAAEAFGPGARVIDLYAGLPPGPYLRGPGAIARHGTTPLSRPTELCLRRTAAAAAPGLAARGWRRVRLVGHAWQTWALRGELAARGIAAVGSEQPADALVVCDDELDREPAGFTGESGGLPVVTLRSGERPWLDRVATARGTPPRWPGGSDEPVRIALRHDNLLGDVVLSQGVLPQRLKQELFPRAHLRFVTTRHAPNRHGSDTTGWCASVCETNPWIDEVLAIEPGREDDAWAEGFDLAYRIDGSGWVYDHVFDHHALHVELPPGRTDAAVHLTDPDRAVAERVLGARRGRPRIAVNMSLIAPRFRGWGEDKTAELCARLERAMDAEVVWIGFVDWNGRSRLRDGPRPLTVREQAAVLARCDVHVTTQGAGANLSAAVGTQTLSLTGCHPCWREGVAYFNNPYIDDPSRRHVELSLEGGVARARTYTRERRPPWRIAPGETERDVRAYAHELWDRETPPDRLPARECYQRTRGLSVDDVAETVAAILRARAAGGDAPGD